LWVINVISSRVHSHFFRGNLMNQKLYVGNLPYGIGDNELRSVFSTIGEVHSARVMIDRDSGRSKGFGFVEMSSADAKKAVEQLNGSVQQGRNINVSEAREKPSDGRAPRGGGGRSGGGWK
jgi:cold-inducible RNA-binding protein